MYESDEYESDEPTPVNFRFWRGDVIALFPSIPADFSGNVLSYQHIGQHGAASYRMIMNELRAATNAEYAALEKELIQIGYRLDITE